MDAVTQVQILDEAVCIFHGVNTFLERYESNYSPTSYGQTGFFGFSVATSIGEGKLRIPTC